MDIKSWLRRRKKAMNIAHKTSVMLLSLGMIVLCGCARINGDPFWISCDQHEVILHDRVYAFGDSHYDIADGNLPFMFTLTSGTYEFGCCCHELGSPRHDQVLTAKSILRFEIRQSSDDIGSVFLISNGVFRLIRHGDDISQMEVRCTPNDTNVKNSLITLGNGIGIIGNWLSIICVPPSGFSIKIHRPGVHGTVIVGYFKRQKETAQLVIQSLDNMNLYRYPWL